MNKIKLFFVGLIQFSCITTLGQEIIQFTNPDKTSFQIPFEMSQNLIILPIRINGSQTMKFILDSGITKTIITELTGVDSVDLNYTKEVTLAGLGKDKSGSAYSSRGNEIRIDHPDRRNSGIIGLNMDIFILMESHFELSKQLGIKVNGLIGSDFFSSFIVEIDYDDRLISFYSPENFNYKRKTKRYTEIPLEISNHKAFVEATLIQNSGLKTDVKLLIDTGASLAMWIALFSDPAIELPQNTIPAMLGQGLNGDIKGVNGRIKGIIFAGTELLKPVIAFPDSLSVKGMMRDSDRNGSLGNDVLRRFDIIFDYPHARMFVRANRKVNDIFSYNKSGMEVEKPYINLPLYTVYNVTDNSPAHNAGIRAGDQVKAINYMSAANLNLDDINSILHGHESTIIRLKIIRDEEEIRVKFALVDDI